jgi:signal transduction histidine kinase
MPIPAQQNSSPSSATTPASQASSWRSLLPRTLFARVTLMIVAGLAAAQALTFAAVQYERDLTLRAVMMSGIELDIASSVAILNRLPAGERASWLERLERPNYRFDVKGSVDGEAPRDPELRGFSETIVGALRPFPVTRLAQDPATRAGVLMQVRLDDGNALVIHARRVPKPVSAWVVWTLLAELLVLATCAWLAVRLLTRPLADLAAAADELGPDLRSVMLDEAGPAEVSRAAHAFNAMQQRIAGYMDERVEILAAISHDLQTPITRMRLRTDLMDETPERDKLRQDLEAMQVLVKEGLAYARTLHGESELPCRLDVDALLESLVSDYQDTGQKVTLEGRAEAPVRTRPQALRRILTNLVDNALKFGGDARLEVARTERLLAIAVIDAGLGIPPDQLDAVLRPFYRVEGSRNRTTGGTGLGLAIAHQLAVAVGAELSLRNREEGGLEARLALPLN